MRRIKEIIWFFVNLTNDFHHRVIELMEGLGWSVSDKNLHFWIIGFIGMLMFVFVHKFFRWVAKWSVKALSFVYTFTLVVFLAVLIEIQQKITDEGNMELDDVIIGLVGFLAFYLLYLCIDYFIKKKMR